MTFPAAQTLGGALIAAREKRGLSQSDVARLTGIAQAQLSRYESDAVYPRSAALAKIADALGVTVTDLLAEGDAPKRPSTSTLVRIDLPAELHAQLVIEATQIGKSMDELIVARLEQSFSEGADTSNRSSGNGPASDEWKLLRSLRSRVHRLTAEHADLVKAREDLATTAPRNERGDLEAQAERQLWKVTSAAHDVQREIHRLEAEIDDLYERSGGWTPSAIGVTSQGTHSSADPDPSPPRGRG